MRRPFFLLASWLLVLNSVYGQKYDNYWVWGRYPDFQTQGWFGNGDAEFLQQPDSLDLRPQWRNQAFGSTCLSLSDRDGNFLAHSDGLRVLDTANAVIENGDSLNYGLYWDWVSPSQISGSASYSIFQGVYGLPLTWSDSMYYLIHLLYDGNIDTNYTWATSSLCYSRLIADSLLPLRIEDKNTSVSSNHPPTGPGSVGSCRHGNGRDWWVVYKEINSNCYHKLLLSAIGLTYEGVQCIGDSTYDLNGIKSEFSLDGSKFSHVGTNAITVLDFDRCTGDFSNSISIPLLEVYDSSLLQNIKWITSTEFSPNNRFLYVCYTRHVQQYDLWDADPIGTRDTVAVTDYFVDTVANAGSAFFLFFQCQTGPDGVIYIAPLQGMRFLSTIRNPNGKGDSCQFGVRDVVLPKFWRASMPYYPNYRLGPLLGSACDTVYNSITESYWGHSPWLKIYPNPAQQEVKLDYNWVEWEKYKAVSCELRDARGTAVMQVQLPKYSSWQVVDVGRLQAGMYTVALRAMSHELREVTLATAKLVKVE